MKPILEIQSVSKKFRINKQIEPYLSIREHFKNFFAKNKTSEDFWALNNIDFNVYPGESIGIIGKNGAGKSTLLKILSKITPPTSGKIVTRGRIASLLEVGTGFHQELTGRENIFLNGSILGLKKAEITKHFDAIIDFSGVEKFIDTPLKRYSSGMQLRLAFAVAAHLEPEIMIIDEVLAVGDSEFQKRCLGKMDEVSKSGRTILFVSHDLNAVSSLCNKVVLLKNGQTQFHGNTKEGLKLYNSNTSISSFYSNSNPNNITQISSIHLEDIENEGKRVFYHNEPIQIKFKIDHPLQNERSSLFVIILNEQKKPVCSFEQLYLNPNLTLVIDQNFLTRGEYSLHTFINQAQIKSWDDQFDICNFEIIDNGSDMQKHGDYNYGNIFGRGKWI